MKHRGGTDFCQLLNVSPICARFPLCSELHVGVISLFCSSLGRSSMRCIYGVYMGECN